MGLKLYADNPGRRTRQIISDVWFVVWCVGWILIARKLYDLLVPLAGPGRELESVGDSLSQNMVSAGDFIDGLPVVGDDLRGPFDRMGQAGQTLAAAGAAQQEVVTTAATYLSICLAVLAISLLALMWLPFRIRFVRRASAAQRFLHASGDLDVFALRALARQPLTALARISPDPAAAWRRGDPAAIRALAGLELRDEGLRVPGVTDVPWSRKGP